MKEILKPLFEVLTGDVAVCDNVIYNYLIMLIIGEISFRFAFSLVGDAYDVNLIRGKSIGSILHWGIRFVIYVVIAYLIRGAIWMYNFIVGLPRWVWWTGLGLVIAVMIGVIVVKFMNGRSTVSE